MKISSMVALAGVVSLAGSAAASVTISLGADAPTYATVLNFDEAGGPDGIAPGNSWSSIGVSSMEAGVGPGFVGNLNAQPGFGWLPDSNVFVGEFGVFMEFSTALTDFSAQVWDNAGPASFFGGGMAIIVENQGVEVGSFFWETPIYGTAGDNWFNITADAGIEFDRIAILGFAFVSPQTIVDNISFNTVPTPGSAGVLVLGAGLAARRRRR